MRSQLEAEETRYKKLREHYENVEKLRRESEDKIKKLDAEKSDLQKTCDELRAELSDLKQKSATAGKDLPEAADLLNQLKTRRKKSKADLTDLEVILEILEN